MRHEGRITVHRGDFATGARHSLRDDVLTMTPPDGAKEEKIPTASIVSLEVVRAERTQGPLGEIAGDPTTSQLIGPTGLAARAARAGSRRDEISFTRRFEDGRQALCSASRRVFNALRDSMPKTRQPRSPE
jgi:hypothetical protein